MFVIFRSNQQKSDESLIKPLVLEVTAFFDAVAILKQFTMCCGKLKLIIYLFRKSVQFIMSVFQLQEWWSVKMSEDEEFDHGCMVVGNIDNSEPAAEKIAVGSLQGMLRIYAPTKPQFRVEDLILEESLGQPILQLLLGRFIPSSTTLGLAVLHPKKLAVYELVPQGMCIYIILSTTQAILHFTVSF